MINEAEGNFASSEQSNAIVYFDGVCKFCNKAVNTFLRADKNGQLKFAPLQGQVAKANLPSHYTEDLQSIVFQENGETHNKTTALLRICRIVGGPWIILYPLIVIPAPIRDYFYELFARNRYKLFGKKDTCRIPTPEEKERFLD